LKKIFTIETLSRFNGMDGLSLLIACQGKVYDVTASYHWRGGRHHALHRCGQDLTEPMKNSPHGLDMLERFPLVGVLVK
jgi:predicted heme/steroid binding protein